MICAYVHQQNPKKSFPIFFYTWHSQLFFSLFVFFIIFLLLIWIFRLVMDVSRLILRALKLISLE
jgi:hypothetical protein